MPWALLPALCLALWSLAPAAFAQPSSEAAAEPAEAAAEDAELAPTTAAEETGIQLGSEVQRAVSRLNDRWLQWLAAFTQGDPDQGRLIVDELLATTRELGFERLPELSAAAAVRAISAAREGDAEKAAWALEAADALDPGRPETSFAAARVSWISGAKLQALLSQLEGYGRLFGFTTLRRLALLNVGFWILAVLALSGVLFVAVQMASKGGGLYRDLAEWTGAWFGRVASYFLAAVLLLWPLLLPYGLLWALLYWSVLLWGYGSPSERGILVGFWVILGFLPQTADLIRQRAALELSPTTQVLEKIHEKRLYGGLFNELGALRASLPDSGAVRHLTGDLHWRLGQWNRSRDLYARILEADGERVGVVNNLGAYYRFKGDLGTATDYFRRATSVDPNSPEAFFNLSKLYSERYLFTEAGAALNRAQELADEKVSAWIESEDTERLLILEEGVERRREIRSELRAGTLRSAGAAESLDLVRRNLSLVVAFGLLVSALAVHLARRQHGYTEPPIDLRLKRGALERIGRALTPGLDSADVGAGIKSYLAVLVPTALLMLPLGARIVYGLPWALDPGRALPWALAVTGLAVFFTVRLIGSLRSAT